MDFPIYLVPIIFFGLVILISSFFIVKQQTAAVIERFGRYQSIRHSGLQIKIPLVDRIAGKLSLKIQQLDVIVETKTSKFLDLCECFDLFNISLLPTTENNILFVSRTVPNTSRASPEHVPNMSQTRLENIQR